MKCYRVLALLTACMLLSMSLLAKDIAAKNRVIGADRVKMDAQPVELMIMLMDLPFNQGEIDLFLHSLDPIEVWANEHREEWNRADKVKDPIPTIFALDVWKSTDVDAAEYIALTIKFTVAQNILSGDIDAKKLKEQVELIAGMIGDPNLPEKSRVDLKKSLNILQPMIEALNNYPPENKRLFEQNRKKLEKGLARVNRFGKPSGQEVAEKPAPKLEKKPLPPGPNYVWKPGDWHWNGKKQEWIWRNGHWKRNRYSKERTASVPAATTPSWINQKVQERGTAVIDTTRYQSSAKARVWARRAAQSDAQRRLIDLVLTLRLDSQTTIRDVLTRDDSDFRLGMIRRIYYVDQDSSDTIYAVTLGLNLNDVYSYMKEKGIYYK